ncbi:N-acetyltransferase family protein [Dethiothermospora halolimnae]|uniref:GNAT family N-acetyltransferase n=1 Tax=Dethiothermospora halolimnae TaxID=3114390 RepID=UPI003CCB9539
MNMIVNGKKIKNIKIRRAKSSDASELVKVVKQIHRETENLLNTPEEFNVTVNQEKDFIKSQSLFLVVEVDGKIVGSSTLRKNNIEKLSHTSVFGITILRDYCNLGIGSKLVEHTISWAREVNIEKIDLEVFENNKPAIRLYKKFGFIVEGRRNKYIKINGEYQDMLLMTKILS